MLSEFSCLFCPCVCVLLLLSVLCVYLKISSALTTIIPNLSQYCLKCCYSDNQNLLIVMEVGGLARKIWFNPPFLWKCLYEVRPIAVFPVFWLLTDLVCLLTYEFCLYLWKIARCSVILLLPLLNTRTFVT
jgi:hypothetical protein